VLAYPPAQAGAHTNELLRIMGVEAISCVPNG
jgi:hypothetical protein